MNLNQAENLANALIREHLPAAWGFSWNRKRRAFGTCNYRTREIQLSRPMTEHGDAEQVRDTVLHEIAHAIAGYEAGHGPVWQAIARRIGGNGERTVAANAAQRAANVPAWVIVHTETGKVMREYLRKPGERTLRMVGGDFSIVPFDPAKHKRG